LQVTEEDIALSFLEENPLSESDKNFTMGNDAYYFATSAAASQLSPKTKAEANGVTSNGHTKSFIEAQQQPAIQSSSSSLSTGTAAPTLAERNDDHPLRVLSQECLTVVSTFTGPPTFSFMNSFSFPWI